MKSTDSQFFFLGKMSKPIKICRKFNSLPNIQIHQDSNEITKRKSEHSIMAGNSKSAKTDSSKDSPTTSTKSEYSKMAGKSKSQKALSSTTSTHSE